MTAPAIVLTDPKPTTTDTRCPRCKASAEERVLSGGFGNPHEVCRKCGWEFKE